MERFQQGSMVGLALTALLALPPVAGAQSAQTTATETADTGSGQRCGEIALQGTQAQITTSPRPNVEAEHLALRSTDALVAPEIRYTRFVADLAAIRKAYPKPGSRGVRSSFGTKALIIEIPAEKLALAAKGDYRGLDCLNRWYGGRIHNVLSQVRMVILRFSALYHPTRLVDAYAKHPDMRLVEADTSGGNGDDIRLCNESFGGVHRYIFQKGSGDCMAGCTEMRYRGYDVTPAGVVTPLEPWTGRTLRGKPDPQPDWVQPGCFPKPERRYSLSPKRKSD